MKKALFDSENVLAVFTDRFGGVSGKPYDSLNLAFHVGDDFNSVLRNRKVILDELRIERLAWMNQVHSDTIKIVDEEGELMMTDAIITKRKKIALMVMVADCVPVIIFDPKKKVIAGVHAGREGTLKRIAEKTVGKMKEVFGCDPEDLLVSIGPSIGACCYSVGEFELKDFRKEFGDGNIKNGKYLDLKAINLDQLVKAGVKKENIEVMEECTSCDKNYFSYRRDERTGRFAGIVMLR